MISRRTPGARINRNTRPDPKHLAERDFRRVGHPRKDPNP